MFLTPKRRKFGYAVFAIGLFVFLNYPTHQDRHWASFKELMTKSRHDFSERRDCPFEKTHRQWSSGISAIYMTGLESGWYVEGCGYTDFYVAQADSDEALHDGLGTVTYTIPEPITF